MLQFSCPHCGTRLQAPDHYAGQGVKCSECKHKFEAPRSEPPSPCCQVKPGESSEQKRPTQQKDHAGSVLATEPRAGPREPELRPEEKYYPQPGAPLLDVKPRGPHPPSIFLFSVLPAGLGTVFALVLVLNAMHGVRKPNYGLAIGVVLAVGVFSEVFGIRGYLNSKNRYKKELAEDAQRASGTQCPSCQALYMRIRLSIGTVLTGPVEMYPVERVVAIKDCKGHTTGFQKLTESVLTRHQETIAIWRCRNCNHHWQDRVPLPARKEVTPESDPVPDATTKK